MVTSDSDIRRAGIPADLGGLADTGCLVLMMEGDVDTAESSGTNLHTVAIDRYSMSIDQHSIQNVNYHLMQALTGVQMETHWQR